MTGAISPSRTERRPRRSALLALCTAAVCAATLVSCSDDSGKSSGNVSPQPTKSAGASSADPSARQSAVESRKAERSASASANSARASEFEASVDADLQRQRKEFRKQLDTVDGKGNAMRDVSLTGKPLSETNGVRTLVANITNRTDKTASFAVQVDISDSDVKVVEKVVVGTESLEADEKAQPLVVSRQPPEPQLNAKIVKAQRY